MAKYPYRDSYFPDYITDIKGRRRLEVRYAVIDPDPLEVEIKGILIDSKPVHPKTKETILNNLEDQFIKEIIRKLKARSFK